MRRSLFGVLLAAAACGGSERVQSAADAGGTLIIATPADADALLPPLVMTATGRAVADNLFERLAEPAAGDTVPVIGDAGWAPRLATRWRWSADSLSLAFDLDPRARFHDGVPVRARDVVFSFNLVRNPATGSATGPLLANVDSVTATDSLTAVAWFKRKTPQRFYDIAYQIFVLPSHLLDTIPPATLRTHPAARRPVGSGRFRFVEWRPGERIEIASDTSHPRGRAVLDRVIWSLVPEPPAAMAQLVAGEADLVENLRGGQFAEVRAVPTLKVVSIRTRTIGSMLFDARPTHPVFGDARVRRAIAHAVDAAAIARNVFDSLGKPATGPLPGLSATTVPAFDRARAAALLDSAGWHAGPDGTRSRNGRALSFAILVPGPSRPRVQMATLIQESLRGLGIAVRVEQRDFPAFVAAVNQHRFDAAIQAYSTDPSPFGLAEQWGSRDGQPVPGNVTGWVSDSFVRSLEAAERASTAAAVRAQLQQAVDVLVQEAPAVFLVQPSGALAMHARLVTSALREDGWWATLADWSVDPARRLARDASPAP
ncbi:MAG: peptide ABC transporter substrate-binding protein [Gemmatimonadaceae bacterium]|nr:peptide ABC transporter substrate-binding protein [Gemmatimonadaceae bacterium]